MAADKFGTGFRLLIFLIALLAGSVTFSLPAFGQTLERYDQWAEQGGKRPVVASSTSTTTVQQTIPSATVTVYLQGTLTLASIFTDRTGLTPKANPFTADPITGYYFFYADTNARYDVQISGGIPPNNLLTPYVLADQTIGGVGVTQLQEEGVALPQRTALNFVGSSFTGVDDPGNNRTNLVADSDLNALASNATTGLWVKTGVGTGLTRTITGTANQVNVSNGDGVAGNPVLSTPQNIHTAATPTFADLTLSDTTPTLTLLDTTGGESDFDLGADANIVQVKINGGATLTSWNVTSPNTRMTNLAEVSSESPTRTGAAARYFRVLTPADTGLTADTQNVGIRFGGNSGGTTVTRQFTAGGGAFAAQAEYQFIAPTYSFTSADSIVSPATVEIDGPPIAGTNATFTQPVTLRVLTGKSWFGGDLVGLDNNERATLRIDNSTGSGFPSSLFLLHPTGSPSQTGSANIFQTNVGYAGSTGRDVGVQLAPDTTGSYSIFAGFGALGTILANQNNTNPVYFGINNTIVGTIKSSGFFVGMPKTMTVDSSVVGNVGGGLDTLHTYTLPANTLSTNGDWIRAVYGGNFAGNDTDKRVNASFGGQVYEGGGVVDIDGGNWRLEAEFVRLTSTTVRITSIITYGGVSINSANAVGAFGIGYQSIARITDVTVANLNSNTMVMAVQGEGAANNDVVQNLSIVQATQIQ